MVLKLKGRSEDDASSALFFHFFLVSNPVRARRGVFISATCSPASCPLRLALAIWIALIGYV